MTAVEVSARRSSAGRRTGYVIGALVDVGLLCAIHLWPGWESVPFLTGDTPRVLGLVDATLVVGTVVYLVQLVRDPRWLVAVGGVVTTAVGLASTIQVLRVFPFELDGAWPTVVRVLLWLGIVGAGIGLLVGVVNLARAVVPRGGPGSA